MTDIIFERFDKNQHNRNDFDCGAPELNRFLKQLANQQKKRGLNAIYVATEIRGKVPKRILGFYTISSSTLSFQNLPDDFTKKIPENHLIPTIKIGRLAKHIKAPKGFGGVILATTLRRILKISVQIGVMGADVDAKNDLAKAFYLKYGFIPFLDNPMAPFMPMAAKANNSNP